MALVYHSHTMTTTSFGFLQATGIQRAANQPGPQRGDNILFSRLLSARRAAIHLNFYPSARSLTVRASLADLLDLAVLTPLLIASSLERGRVKDGKVVR